MGSCYPTQAKLGWGTPIQRKNSLALQLGPARKNGGDAELRRRRESNLVLFELSYSGLLLVVLIPVLNVLVLNILLRRELPIRLRIFILTFFIWRELLPRLLVRLILAGLLRIGLPCVDVRIVLIGLAQICHYLPSSRVRCWSSQVSDVVELRAQEVEFEATIFVAG